MIKKSVLLFILMLLIPELAKADLNRRGEIYLALETNPYQISTDSLNKESITTRFVLDFSNGENEKTYFYYTGNFYFNTRYSNLNYLENKGGISHNFVNSNKFEIFGGGSLKLSYAKDYADGYSNYQETRAYLNGSYFPNQNTSLFLGGMIGYRAYLGNYFSNYLENKLTAQIASDILTNLYLSLMAEYFYKNFSTDSYQIKKADKEHGHGHCGHHTDQYYNEYTYSYEPNDSQLILSAYIEPTLTENIALNIGYKRSINFSTLNLTALSRPTHSCIASSSWLSAQMIDQEKYCQHAYQPVHRSSALSGPAFLQRGS